jgi:hypothetical protein
VVVFACCEETGGSFAGGAGEVYEKDGFGVDMESLGEFGEGFDLREGWR